MNVVEKVNVVENLVVLAIDGLQASYLGPYGNTWVPTPTWDELSAESMLVEWNMAEATDLRSVYGAYWMGRCGRSISGGASSLAGATAAVGKQTLCLTDCAEVGTWAAEAGFQTVEAAEVEQGASSGGVAGTDAWEETPAARWAMAVAERLTRCESPFLAWVHWGSITNQWRAPYAWRERFRDEEDPRPGEFQAPPEGPLELPADPDQLLDFAHGYGAEVMLTDACLSVLLEGLADVMRRSATALLVTAPRGYALGDHGWLGTDSPALYSELLQVPGLLKLPDARGRLERRSGIFRSSDLYATCCDLCGAVIPSRSAVSWCDGNESPDRVVMGEGERVALRTPAWFAAWNGPESFELYAKPDDRWEVNNVAQRRSDIEAAAKLVLEDYLEQMRAEEPRSLMELPLELSTVGE